MDPIAGNSFRLAPSMPSAAQAGLADAERLAARREQLRTAVDELVGQVFYGPMLQSARNSPFKGEFGHGGRGEEIFGAQLDAELAKRAGQGTRTDIADAIYERMVGKVK